MDQVLHHIYSEMDPFIDEAPRYPEISMSDSYQIPNLYNALRSQSWFTPCYQEPTGLVKPPESDPMLESILDIRALSISSTMSSSMIPSMASSMSSSTSSDLTSSKDPLASEYDRVWSEAWRAADKMEPMDSNGRSIYLKFLISEGGFYQCLLCLKKLGRQDRAIGHIRGHFNHRPFRCDGTCGVPQCYERFCAQSYLRAHIKRPKEKRNRPKEKRDVWSDSQPQDDTPSGFNDLIQPALTGSWSYWDGMVPSIDRTDEDFPTAPTALGLNPASLMSVRDGRPTSLITNKDHYYTSFSPKRCHVLTSLVSTPDNYVAPLAPTLHTAVSADSILATPQLLSLLAGADIYRQISSYNGEIDPERALPNKSQPKTNEDANASLQGHLYQSLPLSTPQMNHNSLNLCNLWNQVSQAPWTLADDPEPMENGRSTLLEFLTQEYGSYTCKLCGKSNPREDRAVSHIRKHLNHRPFKCEGRCGNPEWSAHAHLSSIEYLVADATSHIVRTASTASHTFRLTSRLVGKILVSSCFLLFSVARFSFRLHSPTPSTFRLPIRSPVNRTLPLYLASLI